ncbi:lantibiotic immunity ABC transporter MutE/EpiE family permease subunit [Romboutsia ilealis]|uniref:Lantibiotic immunity ABC transporter MutE/EpiE family permease subunit n=1 Tax=Romboutsia faecis TaxID=2764597 RepID=A0ABR7JPS2_9FIRM|nr:lantibiotic immunity ABC transporter MutE/EpiE family permease subunit [Romboutsia faecis]MBC5996758.1 lantibiotic immunity ABC transporter MutE/EpiE family permease subunit [Romboutsia faecis]MRN24285.1 lantibiotic immunity ABC transporter MutE/EpiE family permease subunit [Romboutsia ilealis]
MINMIKSEHLKLKKSFQKMLIWLAPTITLLLASILIGGNYIQSGGYNWWYILILPGILTLITSFVINNDNNRKYHGLFSVVIDKDKIWYSKIILCTIYLALTCLVFFLEVTLMGYLFKSTISIKNSFLASIILFITFSWQIPLFMYISMRFKTGTAMIISMICNCGIGIICAVKSTWWIPFAIPSRLMCHVIGVLPNGLSVENRRYIFDIKIILIGLIVTVMLYILISYLSARWFKEEEI